MIRAVRVAIAYHPVDKPSDKRTVHTMLQTSATQCDRCGGYLHTGPGKQWCVEILVGDSDATVIKRTGHGVSMSPVRLSGCVDLWKAPADAPRPLYRVLITASTRDQPSAAFLLYTLVCTARACAHHVFRDIVLPELSALDDLERRIAKQEALDCNACAIQAIQPSTKRGRAGRVYEATMALKDDPIPVVLKVWDVVVHDEAEDQIDDIRIRSRKHFCREITWLQRINHPAVVSMYTGQTNGMPYMALEHMAGGSLFSYMHQGDLAGMRAPIATKLQWMIDIASALVHIHMRMRIVHGDLVSSNILLNATRDHAKIADFGLSQAIGSDGIQCGTYYWMPLEVLSGAQTRAETATDMYSLGTIIWEILDGQFPYMDYECIKGPKPSLLEFRLLNSARRYPGSVYVSQYIVLNKLIADLWNDNPRERPTAMHVLQRLKQLRRSIVKG